MSAPKEPLVVMHRAPNGAWKLRNAEHWLATLFNLPPNAIAFRLPLGESPRRNMTLSALRARWSQALINKELLGHNKTL